MGDISRLQRFASERRQSLLNALAYMKDITLLTDVTLMCNGKPHPAHRVILAASSCYFRDIFQNKKKVSRINVHDVDEETFDAVIKFLYTGALTIKDIEGLKLAKVLSAFRGLNVHCLDNITSCALDRLMDRNNFYAMWEMVKELQLKESETIVVKYVASNLKDCCHSQYFPLLTLQQMISLMSSKYLVTGSSNIILEAVAMWGSYDQDRRAKYLTSLLSIIGLTVDPKLRQELLTYQESGAILPIREDAVKKGECENTLSSLVCKPQSKESSINYKVSIGSKNRDGVEIQRKSKQYRQILHERDPVGMINDVDVQQCGNKLLAKHILREKTAVLTDVAEIAQCSYRVNSNYGIGSIFQQGIDKLNRESEFISSTPPNLVKSKFNSLGKKSILSFSPIKSDIDSHNSQISSPINKIDSVGKPSELSLKTSSETVKTDSNVFISTKIDVEKLNTGNEYLLLTATTRYGIAVQQSYSVNTRQWLPMKRSLTLPLDAAANFYFNRCIYIVGGETVQGKKLNSAYLFNLEEQNIKKLSPLTVARSETSMTQLSGSIYVIGGRGLDNKPLAHVEFYSPNKDEWQCVANLRKARIQPNVAAADGVIYVVGGGCGDEFRINTTCEYLDNTVNQWTEMCPISRLHADSFLLITSHQERIYALQCQKPDKLFFYLPRQNKWVHMETNPRVSRISSFISCNKALWLVDRNGKILKYDDTTNCWQTETKLPPDLIWPVSVYVVDFADE